MYLDTFHVDRRFCGPPTTGNGGYVGGRLASYLEGAGSLGGVDAQAVRVRLHSPPPLDEPLEVRRGAEDSGVGLWHGDACVAEAVRRPLTLDVPGPPSLEQAQEAATRYVGFEGHPYPTCFVCGPDRTCGDGLCIFAGPVDGRPLVAAPWTPDASLADRDGRVAPEFVWAALDCPGCFSFELTEGCAILLGQIHVSLQGRIDAGEPCLVVGWEIGREGRKHHVGTAIYTADGACRGRAAATWFDVPWPEK